MAFIDIVSQVIVLGYTLVSSNVLLCVATHYVTV